jgi:hypothetical protein
MFTGNPFHKQSKLGFIIFANMVKRMITLWMACFFLMGSIFLPLGDFSLMRDIPAMYRNYSKIASPDELGVLDFIGDYLLHGKEFLGHNGHDKTQTPSNNVQFRHQANPLSIIFQTIPINVLFEPELKKNYRPCSKITIPAEYPETIYRPPLS